MSCQADRLLITGFIPGLSYRLFVQHSGQLPTVAMWQTGQSPLKLICPVQIFLVCLPADAKSPSQRQVKELTDVYPCIYLKKRMSH